MATVHDLIDGLEKTGTGERQLTALRRFAAERPMASAGETVEWMKRERSANLFTGKTGLVYSPFVVDTGIGDVTVAKAEHLAAGRPLEDLLGKPPPNYEGEKMIALAKTVAQAVAEKMDERQQQANERNELPGTADAVKKTSALPVKAR
jgi:hypothetical protein